MNKISEENINHWISQINNDYKTAISVDCVIFGYNEQDLKVLLMECDMPPFQGMLSLVGNLVMPNETLNQSAKRVLKERTGIDHVYMEQVEAFSSVDRHPLGRVITVAYYSLVQLNDDVLSVTDKNDKLSWVDTKDIKELAFDHKTIFDTCLANLRRRVREKPVGFSLLPEKFSLKQLQTLYEIILDIELDKRNFRRKLKSLEILQDAKENQEDVNHRPAKLYSFDKEKYSYRKKKGFSFDL